MNFVEILGKFDTDPAVKQFFQQYRLDDESDAQPFRRYVGSQSRGIDMVLERGRVLSVQVYLLPSGGFERCTEDLPFGLKADMNQEQIHTLLGINASSEGNFSQWQVDDERKVTFDFDGSRRLKLVTAVATHPIGDAPN